MSDLFEADRVHREKEDPVESSSLQFIAVPLVLLGMLLGFGTTYLATQTDGISFVRGDSRTSPTPQPANLDQKELGRQIFQSNCQACHQANGAGLGTTFPPLDGSEWVDGEPERLSAILLHGIQGEIKVKGQTFNGVMPTFKTQLKPAEIAAVATYIRSNWSNHAPAVDVSVVEKVAQATASRTAPWKGGAELNSQSWK